LLRLLLFSDLKTGAGSKNAPDLQPFRATGMESLPTEAVGHIVECLGAHSLPRLCRGMREACLRLPTLRLRRLTGDGILVMLRHRREYVQRLTLDACTIKGEDVTAILDMCPSLRVLNISKAKAPGIDFAAGARRASGDDASDEPTPFSRLRHLRIEDSLFFNVGYLVRWGCSQQYAPATENAAEVLVRQHLFLRRFTTDRHTALPWH
jgi:hypothetical protein